MTAACRVCRAVAVEPGLDLGPQPVRNRYRRDPGEPDGRHPMVVGVCPACGTVQLLTAPPLEELRPRLAGIIYHEPEGHLDQVADQIAGLPGIGPSSTIAGLTYKDDTTLDRLRRRGLGDVWRPDLRYDLRVTTPHAGIESVQAVLTPETALALRAKFGRPDVLVVRHVLEHTHDPAAALAWARHWLRPGGYLVCEVPDATRALERPDYTTLWEEHTLYFTPATLRDCLQRHRFEVLALTSYPYPLEDSLVAVARAGTSTRTGPTPAEEQARAMRFFQGFARCRERVRRQLDGFGRAALFGAGHHAVAYVGLYGLAGRFEFVADDNPRKQGLLLPGTELPIRPATELLTRDIELCLMTVRPEAEDAVAARTTAFIARGGVLASIFPDSRYALRRVGRVAGEVA